MDGADPAERAPTRPATPASRPTTRSPARSGPGPTGPSPWWWTWARRLRSGRRWKVHWARRWPQLDFRDQVGSQLPVIIGVVIAAAFLILLAAFRSPVLALKAAILNLLSIGAAYGSSSRYSSGAGARHCSA